MYTVVIADGGEEFRQALIRQVDWEAAGFHLAGEAADGVEALKLVKRLKPDLLLTEVRMPLMSGIELARTVREESLCVQIVFLSGFDDFTYAQQAIEYNVIKYLVKPISSRELMEELKKIRIKIDKLMEERIQIHEEQKRLGGINLFLPLLLDSFSGGQSWEREQALRQEAVLRGLLPAGQEPGGYVVLVVSFLNSRGENQTWAGDVDVFNRILWRYMRHISFYTDGRIVSLLRTGEFFKEEDLHSIAGDISQRLKAILKLRVFMGASRIFFRLDHCHEAYLEAMDALVYAWQRDAEIFVASEIEETDSLAQEALQTWLSKIGRILRNGTREELNSCLEYFFDWIKEERLSLKNMQLAIVKLTADVFWIIETAAGSEAFENLRRLAPYPGQLMFGRLEEIRESCTAFCMKARDLMEEYHRKGSFLLCDRVLSIVNSRFMQPGLSLRTISKEVSVSPNYLSTLIKRHTGRTFMELIIQKRMEMARDLLLGTNMKVHELAQKCGYKDQHYFSYCFKKSEGMSPNEFRRKHKESAT